MSKFLPDTSCMVPAVSTWHEHHPRAAREIEQRLADGQILVVAAPALVETYAVLTRLPPPYRLSPSDSLVLLERNFMNPSVEVVALSADDYRRLLQSAPNQPVTGGQVYDAVIAACGLAATVDALLTFNERHFLPYRSLGLEIVVPA